jgi:hypothetical protein
MNETPQSTTVDAIALIDPPEPSMSDMAIYQQQSAA